MNTEGIGCHAPKRIKELLNSSDRRIVVNAALRIASHRREYMDSGDQWKRGLIGDLEIPGIGTLPATAAPLYVGLCAEAATIVYLNRATGLTLSIKDCLLANGDGGGDITAHGCSIQVKCRQADSIHAKQKLSLVRYATDRGRIVFPNTTALVFCETTIETSCVSLLGWMYVVHAKQLEKVPARKGNHFNIEVPDFLLEPMSSLVDNITARMEFGNCP